MRFISKFWNWYSGHKTFNTGLALGLFLLQLCHLYWLTAHVVFFRLFGESYFNLTGVWQVFIIVVDYTEIPALILTSLVYINEFREGKKVKSLIYLFLLNVQWIHLFWITDEVVLEQFTGVAPILLPVWLSWLAIGIDYLELPVILDTSKKFVLSLYEDKASVGAEEKN
ncbi:MAG: hypothetical protein EXS59_00135 [Candidatus Taylorbacteria bacterium]|nr:hypothetical protein [Candidatus Taylorbacteria bacterium]